MEEEVEEEGVEVQNPTTEVGEVGEEEEEEEVPLHLQEEEAVEGEEELHHLRELHLE